MDILVHGEIIDPLSNIVLRDKAFSIGKNVLKKLKEIIPREQFKVSLQAAIGGKIIAREDIPAANLLQTPGPSLESHCTFALY